MKTVAAPIKDTHCHVLAFCYPFRYLTVIQRVCYVLLSRCYSVVLLLLLYWHRIVKIFVRLVLLLILL